MPPLYESVCAKCKRIHVYRSPINERDKTPPKCCDMQTLRKMVTPPMGKVIGPAAG
jgi:hypothetical protein